MGTYGLWLWLLVNLRNDPQTTQRIAKRDVDGAGECPSQESRQLNSFLWAFDRNPPVYLFGTIHVPYTKVWDYIPANSERAFYNSQHIYFELDFTDEVNANTLAKCQILPKGTLLRDVIPKKLFRRIKKHLLYIKKKFTKWITSEQREMGLNPIPMFKKITKGWHKKRPIWIMLLLNTLNEYDTKNRGVSVLDTFLISEAISRNKKKGSIESVEEQCGPLNALNNSQVIIALNQTLVLHEKISRGEAKLTYSTRELIYHYNCGDLNELLFQQNVANAISLQNSSLSASSKYEMEEARKLDEYLKEELIYKRNRRMAKRVLKLIEEEPKKRFFFAFGAGHFLGNDSVIEIIKSQGYNITHIMPDDPLPRYGNTRTAKKLKKVRWTRKRKRRRKQKNRFRRMNIDNLWQRREKTWTYPLYMFNPTNRPSVIQRTTRKLSTRKTYATDAIDSSAASCDITAWLIWICLFPVLS